MMRNLLLAIMASVMVATTASAMSPVVDNYDGRTYYSDTVEIEQEVIEADAISDWDYFWGTTLNPINTGWNDFWFQCEDNTKSIGDCVGTIFAGAASVTIAPLIIVGATLAGALLLVPTSTTIAGIPIAVITAGPAMVIT